MLLPARTNFGFIVFNAVMLFGGMTVAEFSPIEWNVPQSKQCGEYTNPDLTAVLATLTQMIQDNENSAFLPKSCMEIKENSPASPSGYYTISKGTSGNAAIVYCNMDDLYSCPALEQTLSGIMKDVSTLDGIRKDIDSLSSDVNSPLYTSCLDVRDNCPQCKSGVYQIALDPNNVNFVSCVFENTYCNVTGPWTKLASWELSAVDPTCPSDLQLFSKDQVYACGIPEVSLAAGCLSLPFFSSPVAYTMVCGKVTGYQKGSPDAFYFSNPTINDPYVDGVSVTRGTPRQHLWSYASAAQENILGLIPCPCNGGPSPTFVGSEHFCESGCPGLVDASTIYTDDPLWDGKECGTVETACCAAPGQPWFHKVLEAPTTDYIEMRLCISESTNNENVLINSYEFYVL